MVASEKHWFVVMTKPRMERQAREHLLRQAYEVYLPLWVDLKKQRGAWKQVHMPMFPRYLFFRPKNAEHTIAPVRSTRGVHQLVRFGVEPAVARDTLIDDIRRLEHSRLETGRTLTPFQKGDAVQITTGPFQGISAEVLSCDQERVVLLLRILGAVQTLAFATSDCHAQ